MLQVVKQPVPERRVRVRTILRSLGGYDGRTRWTISGSSEGSDPYLVPGELVKVGQKNRLLRLLRSRNNSLDRV